jgi:thiol-disulfide isomerase/thioredoxin
MLFTLNGRGQDSGIIFKSNLSWPEIKAEAKTQSKFIFIDCYASWCTPCKMMDEKIYPEKQIGDFFNAHFISIRVQMDRTPNDDEQVRNLYPLSDSLAAQFTVNSYPTFLFFSPDGIPLHKLVGSYQSGQKFIERANDALLPDKQYFTILAQLKDHVEDSVFLLTAVLTAKNAGDDKTARLLANDYLGLSGPHISKSAIDLLSSYILSESDKGFIWFVQHADNVNQVYDEKGVAEEIISAVMFKEEIVPLFSVDGTIIRWQNILTNVKAKYPGLQYNLIAALLESDFKSYLSTKMTRAIADKEIHSNDWRKIARKWKHRIPDYDLGQILQTVKMRYYFHEKSWEQCASAAVLLIDQYSSQLGPRAINDIIWDNVFLHAWDHNTLKKALEDMRNVISLVPDNTFHMDTYANLLYKTGQKKEAIEWESKAIDITKKQNGSAKGFETTLTKMQAGGVTWETSSLY